jgi:phospholipid/cholesterol/gamma-HCH transport system ATP-binding protein
LSDVLDPVTGLPAAIRYVDVHKSFGPHHILRGLNLTIPRGATTVIIGRSGTGKSVTLKHIMGLLRCDSGQIFLGDDDLTQMSDAALRRVRNRFGIVFQHAALFDFMDVFENVAFPLREHTRLSRKQIAARVDELLGAVGLRGSERKFPSELSGGMQKRVALARGLVRDPEFILYDEPTTGLDPILAAAMDELILETGKARPDITSIVISHDMHAVLHIADKVAMLVDGEVYAEGDKDFFRNSEDPLIQQFLTGSLDGPMKV